MKSSTNYEDLLVTGKLLASFGVHGGIKVRSFSGEVAHFKKLVNKQILGRKNGDERLLTVLKCEIKGATPVLYFDGFTSPEAVKLLSGYELLVDKASAAPLAKQEFYLADLVGMTVIYNDKPLGRIVSFIETQQILLETKLLDATIGYIPLIDHYVGALDFKTKQLELLDTSSLFLDLDA